MGRRAPPAEFGYSWSMSVRAGYSPWGPPPQPTASRSMMSRSTVIALYAMGLGACGEVSAAQDAASSVDSHSMDVGGDAAEDSDIATTGETGSGDGSDAQGPIIDPMWAEARSKAMYRSFDDRLLIWGTFSTVLGPRLFGVESAQAESAVSLDLSDQQATVTGDLDVDVWEVGGTWAAADLSERSAFAGSALGGWVGRDLMTTWRWLIFDCQDAHIYGFYDGTLPRSAPTGSTDGEGWTDLEFLPDSPEPSVAVAIGGTQVSLVVDTGSGPTVLSEAAWASVSGGSEPQSDGHLWVTNQGRDVGRLVRLPPVDVAGHRVEGGWAVVVADAHHRSATAPNGVLGWSVLEHFLVGVGLTDKALKLMRHRAETPPPPRTFTQIGVQLSWRPGLGGLQVESVYAPSDAQAQGLQPGDLVTQMDGALTAQWNFDTWRNAQGSAGQSHELVWQRTLDDGSTIELSGQVIVEVLLPL